MIVSFAVFSMQLYFYHPSTLYTGITVISVHLCEGTERPHYLTNSRLSSATGSNIGTVFATDMDKEHTLNSRLQFQIKSQVPPTPSSNLFFIQQDTGVLQLMSHSLNKRIVSNYSLKVLVTDEGKLYIGVMEYMLYTGIILFMLASPVPGGQGMRGDLGDSLEAAAALGVGLLWHGIALFSSCREVNHDS